MSGVVRVPGCCEENDRHGFVRVVALIDGDTGKRAEPTDPAKEYFGDAWEMTIIDARGVTHTLDVSRCPICGRWLHGTRFVEIQPEAPR